MNYRNGFLFHRMLAAIIALFTVAGCSSVANTSISLTATPIPPEPTHSPVPLNTASPTIENVISIPTEDSTNPPTPTAAVSPTPEPTHDHESHDHEQEGVLFEDDFTTLDGNWPEFVFDNYYIGYHEPEWYHIEVQDPNDSVLVPIPEKSFEDFTTEIEVFAETNLSESIGDFRYGMAFRRAGDQYYALTISPNTKQWTVLKNSPSKQQVMAEGVDPTIQGLDVADNLRIDAKGEDLLFYINGHPVAQVSDPEYTSGELGFYVETFDSSKVHIHYDLVKIQDINVQQLPESLLYADDFTTLDGNWPGFVFDNYYVGYHEPEWYHIEVQNPNDNALVVIPERVFDDFTSEIQVFAETNLTDPSGDFRYGFTFRRSGNQWYGFTVSPRTKQWSVLKSSPNGLEVLAQGSDESIQGLDVADKLRVDASGSNFFFYINDHYIDMVSDPDYTTGDLGFFVQTFDTSKTHIHFDSLDVQDVSASQKLCSVVVPAINLREGPGSAYDPVTPLVQNTRLKPLGRNSDGSWIKVRVESSEPWGWVSNASDYLSCNVSVSLLPLSEP
jgi:hypothetical protein